MSDNLDHFSELATLLSNSNGEIGEIGEMLPQPAVDLEALTPDEARKVATLIAEGRAKAHDGDLGGCLKLYIAACVEQDQSISRGLLHVAKYLDRLRQLFEDSEDLERALGFVKAEHKIYEGILVQLSKRGIENGIGMGNIMAESGSASASDKVDWSEGASLGPKWKREAVVAHAESLERLGTYLFDEKKYELSSLYAARAMKLKQTLPARDQAKRDDSAAVLYGKAMTAAAARDYRSAMSHYDQEQEQEHDSHADGDGRVSSVGNVGDEAIHKGEAEKREITVIFAVFCIIVAVFVAMVLNMYDVGPWLRHILTKKGYL